jgi:hypothetical protein
LFTPHRTFAVLLIGSVLSLPLVARGGDFVLGAGLSLDDAEGTALTVVGDVSIGESTWLSAGLGRSRVDLPRFQEIETWYADIGIDTYWDPAGLRMGVAYWGDNDIFDSVDVTGSIYSRNERGTISINGEYRDFELELPPIDILPRTSVPFNAKGLGLSGRLNISKRVDLHLSGMSYEYSVDLRGPAVTRFTNLLSISRLSLLSSLIDWEISGGVGVDVGLRRWQLDVARWRGAIDGGDNHAVTVSFLTPMTARTDIEFAIGLDNSDLYGQVAVFNVFLFFYGGD